MSQPSGGKFKKGQWKTPASAGAAVNDESAGGSRPKFFRGSRPNSTPSSTGRDTSEILSLYPTKGQRFTNKDEFLSSLASYLTKNVNINFSALILQKKKIEFPIKKLKKRGRGPSQYNRTIPNN